MNEIILTLKNKSNDTLELENIEDKKIAVTVTNHWTRNHVKQSEVTRIVLNLDQVKELHEWIDEFVKSLDNV